MVIDGSFRQTNIKGHLGCKRQTTRRQVEVDLAKAHGVELWKIQHYAEADMKFAQLAGAGNVRLGNLST
jgi:hypothetical protein